MDEISTKVLDDFWAVVVYVRYGGGRRLLWSPRHQDWLRSRPYGAGFSTNPVDGHEDEPYDDELTGAAELADVLLRDRICQRCGLEELRDHFVAPDVFGAAALYCVQQPDPRVVASFGGNGTRKHWGSRFGCSAVRAEHFSDRAGEHYVDYGEGLVASQVRDWEWCVRCTRAAGNIARRAHERNEKPWDYVDENENQLHIRRFPFAL